MIIIKFLVFLGAVFISSVLWCCMRMSSYHNTIEDSDYLNSGLTIKDLVKYHKKNKLAATINDGRILYLSKERED